MISKTKRPLESWEQEQVIRWKNRNKKEYPILELLHCSLNGVRLTPGQAVKCKNQGMVKGIPDLFLPVPSEGYHGLFIEMKRRGGTISPEQKIVIAALENQGYKTVVCYGHIDAIKTIKKYLGIEE